LKRFDSPRLVARGNEELHLSGPALLDLMQSVLARGSSFRFKAKGWSMSPFIRDGDVITVSPLAGKVPRVGEVVAFTRPDNGGLVVHRIIAKQGSHVLVRGDGVAEFADGLVPLSNLLGRVSRVERDGRRTGLGLGPERRIIAWFSRKGWLTRIGSRLGAWWRKFAERFLDR